MGAIRFRQRTNVSRLAANEGKKVDIVLLLPIFKLYKKSERRTRFNLSYYVFWVDRKWREGFLLCTEIC